MSKKTSVIPGEYRLLDEPIEINKGARKLKLRVSNTGDRPVQVGSHFHFFEVNRFLSFDRRLTIGMRLDIPAGTAVRFEPGSEMEVELTAIGGNRCVYGVSDLTNGSIYRTEEIMNKAKELGFKGAEK